MQEYKILITFCFIDLKKRFWQQKSDFVIQNRPIKVSLKIKNIDDKVFPGAKLQNINLRSIENKNLNQNIAKEFFCKSLNPNEEVEIEIDSLSTYLYGLAWISCSILPQTPDYTIKTYQLDKNTSQIELFTSSNLWGDGLFIMSQNELNQSKTNKLILWLTIITTLQGVFGLKNVAIFLLSGLQQILALGIVVLNYLSAKI